jgi:cellulose synthase/poly-beta-1,6-N-acetylglucosamine synthase-like glycosyltransferase
MLWLAVAGAFCILDSVLRFALLCIRAALPPKNHQANGTQNGKGIVLIAAHNEAGTIGPTISSLQENLYEWSELQLWVIADRCSDETAVEAANAGAQVAIREDGNLGKGAVLAWWLEHHRQHWLEQDALVILDADSRLAQGSLTAFSHVLHAGADVAQGFVAPLTVSRAGRLAGWSEVLMQQIDDQARQRCNWSVPLRGTGMVFRASVLSKLAPKLHTLAEDLELDCLLAAQTVRVAFVPQARIFDPKPQQSAGASRQRARWLQGQLQVLRDYRGAIIQALTQGNVGNWFLLWLLFLRPKILFMALRVLLLALALLMGSTGRGLAAVMALGLSLDVLYYLIGAAFVEDPRVYLRDLLAVPRYAAMWMYGFGLATVKRGWLRAGR